MIFSEKGFPAGKLIVYPSRNSRFVPEDNIIIGNVASTELLLGRGPIPMGQGAKFVVRNSGV